jgi:hypothetical protein
MFKLNIVSGMNRNTRITNRNKIVYSEACCWNVVYSVRSAIAIGVKLNVLAAGIT